jgi:hypothetical protein
VFNTLPSNSVGGDGSTTTATGSLGVLPTLKPKTLADSAKFYNLNFALEGFNGDGDRIELPTGSGNTLDYYNNANAVQWTVSRTADINAATTNWCGFYYDKTDDLIYMVAVDSTTTPDTFFTASVNSSGTVVNIGNAQPSVDFAATPGWHNGPNSNQSSLIQRESDGSGNLALRMSQSSGFQEMIINISNGAIVSDPTIPVADSNYAKPPLKMANGLYIYPAQANLSIADETKTYPIVSFPTEYGGYQGAGNNVKLIGWKGYIATASINNAAISGPRWWDLTTMNAFANNIKRLF